MNRHIALSAAAIALSTVFTGCASADAPADEAGDSADDLSVNANFGYYVFTRQDMRRCVSPMCGGMFVKRANQDKTRCADGTMQAECYVSALDLAGMDLDEATKIAFDDRFQNSKGAVRAFMSSTVFNGNRIGKLKVREAWNAVGNATIAPGTFYRIGDNGLRCITAPCPTLSAFTLNTRDEMPLKSADLNGVGSAADRAKANAAIATAQGVLATGSIALPKCVPTATNCGPWFTAQAFYLPVVKVATPGPRACGGLLGAGCNAGEYCSYKPEDMCGAADQMGTCAKKAEVCLAVVMPVCGCDDKTYSNACMASNAGVSVVRSGACR
jgi:Kazal-type serine protease inhibitor domain